MELGVVGKPNTGKSTFFTAATMAAVEAANYPFTTIDPNRGMAYVSVECPCQERDGTCDPNQGRCVDGTRFVPVQLMDIAGLVPGAAEGRGMGNEFLDAVREADALIHVIDCSGMTNERGEPVEPGSHDPVEDVRFVQEEFDAWMASLVRENWERYMRRLRSVDTAVDRFLADKLSGLGVTIADIREALRESDTPSDPNDWEEDDVETFVTSLRMVSKPHVFACNKMDVDGADETLERLRAEFPDEAFLPMSAQAELTLRKAAEKEVVEYVPGDEGFAIVEEVSEEQEQGLNRIKDLMDRYGSTGVQDVLDTLVLDVCDMIVVFPVEDGSSWTDGAGNMLPDAMLLPEGSTPVELAYAIHSDIGDDYVKAIDARSGTTMSKEDELESGAVVRIVT